MTTSLTDRFGIWFGRRIRDDRGEWIESRGARAMWSPAPFFPSIVYRYSSPSRWELLMSFGVYIGVAATPFAALPALMAVRAGPGLAMLAWSAFCPVVVTWTVAFLLCLLLLPRVVRSSVCRRAAALVRFGICPACGYSLDGTGVEPDGCVLCPECASAWRGDRIARCVHRTKPERVELIGSFRMPCQTASTGRVGLDDRGRRTPFMSRLLLGSIEPGWHREERERLQRDLWQALTARGKPTRLLVAAIGGLVILLPIVADQAGAVLEAATYPARIGWLDLASSLGIVALGWICGMFWTYFVLVSDVGIPPDHVRRIMLRFIRCPSCAVLIQGDSEPDGCTVCPECGAAWRMPRYDSIRADALDDRVQADESQAGPALRGGILSQDVRVESRFE